jgi:diaminohydroxyphosphoribosylaminopyrimidine deaminase / 5-amino-6-(5-phosphoribosylamino)uracil reductase
MDERDDLKFMRRCIDLASGAEGFTYPNPLVGSVIVHEGKIIGEGYHLKAGTDHAEVAAVKSVKDSSKLGFSTLYVNLEPCSHHGKTPPCADFIISNSIKRVVVGTIDTNAMVSGEGITKLRNAGVEVITGVAEEECRRLNRRFFTFHEKKRPYITLKWAESNDGFLDYERTEDHPSLPNWISGKPERVLVHKWRASEQAILVGAGTVKADDPGLNVREWSGVDPLRIVLSGSGSLNSGSIITESDGTIVFTHRIRNDIPRTVQIVLNEMEESSVQIVRYLYGRGIQSLFIEGGAMVLNHFISTGLWDEMRVFRGKSTFSRGVKAPATKGKLMTETDFNGSCLSIYLNT